jgi:hypothetical protein
LHPAAESAKQRPSPTSEAMTQTIEDDVAAVGRIGAVKTILRVLAEATGLRIALVARVTPDSWTACAVLDEAGFGLKPGDKLEVATTY